MNIVFCYWKSICEEGMTNGFKDLGHTVIRFDENCANKDLDVNYIKKLSEFLQKQADVDFVFSVNFIPIIAKVCNIHKIYYLSYTVDSPCMTLYSKSVLSPYVKAFVLDYELYMQHAKYAPENVFYLSLGADMNFYDKVTSTVEDHKRFDCDVSFIGSYHTEMCIYDKVKDKLPENMQGYVDGLIDAQLNVMGYNFLADSIDDKWANEFKEYVGFEIMPDYIDDNRNIVADQYIGYKCTQRDRIKTLNAVAEKFKLDLYTTEEKDLVPKANFRGIADSKKMMPKIFQCSKINLNMTAKTIKTGLAQRIFDVMAVGGFLISNYQSEIPEYFVPGEDIVLYESIPDLLNKIEYYLEHEDERIAIAKSGQEKVKKHHSYKKKLEELISLSNLPNQ